MSYAKELRRIQRAFAALCCNRFFPQTVVAIFMLKLLNLLIYVICMTQEANFLLMISFGFYILSSFHLHFWSLSSQSDPPRLSFVSR